LTRGLKLKEAREITGLPLQTLSTHFNKDPISELDLLTFKVN
jgi:hypothetical protein